MADATTPALKTPWHLWVIGVVSLLWNAMGALDFTMTQLASPAYLKGLTAEQLAYIHGFPLWSVLAWGIATWGSVLGSLLLLLRCRWAVCAFCASFVGMVLTNIYSYGVSDCLKVMHGGKGMIIFSALIFVISALLWVYARAMRRGGVLR